MAEDPTVQNEEQDKEPARWESLDVGKVAESMGQCGADLTKAVLERDSSEGPSRAAAMGIATWLATSCGVGDEEELKKIARQSEENKMRRRIRDRVSEILTIYVDTSTQKNPLNGPIPVAE